MPCQKGIKLELGGGLYQRNTDDAEDISIQKRPSGGVNRELAMKAVERHLFKRFDFAIRDAMHVFACLDILAVNRVEYWLARGFVRAGFGPTALFLRVGSRLNVHSTCAWSSALRNRSRGVQARQFLSGETPIAQRLVGMLPGLGG
jgi:hypothetical protein